MMTCAERVRRTLAFEKPDRYPVIHTPGGIGGTPERIKGLRALYAEFPGDFCDSVQFKGYVDERASPDEEYYREETDEWGVTWSFDHPILGGIATGHPLTDWKDLDRYEIPKAPLLDPENRRALEEEYTKRREGGYILGGNADGALYERMQWLRGYQNLLLDLAEDREEIEVLADRILDEHMLPQMEECLKLGAEFIGFTDDWGSQTNLMIRPEQWRRIFKPRYARMVQLCHEHGARIWMHTDGETTSVIPDLIEIGVDCLNPQFSCMDLHRLRELTYGKMTIMTDINQHKILGKGTPEQVRDEIKRVIDILGHPDGGLILRAFLQIYVPLPNCRAALQAFRDFGNLQERAG